MLLPLCGSGLGLYASVLHRGAADCSEAVALNIDWQLTLLPCQEWKQARGEGKSERMEAKLLSVVMVATRLRGNKINELFASVRVRWEYQHSTLLHLVVGGSRQTCDYIHSNFTRLEPFFFFHLLRQISEILFHQLLVPRSRMNFQSQPLSKASRAEMMSRITD